MNRQYLPYLRKNTMISLGLVLLGIYAVHIAPHPAPDSIEVPSIPAKMLIISSIFLFACACFIEVASLVKLFESWALRLGSLDSIQHFSLVIFGIAGGMATIYATIYVVMPTFDVVWPWLVIIIIPGSSGLALAHWVDTQMRERRYY